MTGTTMVFRTPMIPVVPLPINWAKVILLPHRERPHGRLDTERYCLRAKEDERADHGVEERLSRGGELTRVTTRDHKEESDIDQHQDDHDRADLDDKVEDFIQKGHESEPAKGVDEGDGGSAAGPSRIWQTGAIGTSSATRTWHCWTRASDSGYATPVA